MHITLPQAFVVPIAASVILLSWLDTHVAKAAPAANQAADERTYLKKDGAQWWKVVRRDGVIVSREAIDEAAAEAAIPDSPAASVAPGYLRPYVTYPVGSWPEAVAIGDLNHDGLQDVALVTSFYFDPENDFSLFVFLQNGAGGLRTPVRYPVGGLSGYAGGTVDVGDVNSDGRDDVVVGRNRESIVVFVQNAAGTLDPGVSYPTFSTYKIRIGDFNSDGRLDVAGIAWGSQSRVIVIFTQQASGALALAASFEGTHDGYDDLEVGDLNGDGRDDLVVMSGQGFSPNTSVFLQKAAGLFDTATPYDLGGNEVTKGIGIGDLNGDTRADLAMSYGGNRPYSYVAFGLQTSAGTLGSLTPLPSYDIPSPVEVADVDSNQRADLIVAHRGWYALGVYRQRTNGTLGDEELFPLPDASYNPHGLAVGDVNGDGANDVVYASYNDGLVVFLQNTTTPLPTGVNASVASSGQVLVTWNPFPGATSYEVYRRGPGESSFSLISTAATTAITDTAVSANTAYLYRVRAVDAYGTTGDSIADLATTVPLSDDPIVQQATALKAAHITELRTAILAVRTLAGIPAVTFTDDVVPGTTVRAIHLAELRTALDAALSALSLTPGPYLDPISAGVAIKASHIQGIRARVK